MPLKYFIQLPKDIPGNNVKKFLQALEEMDEQQFMMFGDEIKIYPYDPDEDEVIVSNMKLEDALKIWKEQYQKIKNKDTKVTQLK